MGKFHNLHVEGVPPKFEVKRLDVDGLTILWNCPRCGQSNSQDVYQISFAKINQWKEFYLDECKGCWTDDAKSFEWKIRIKPVLGLEVDELP